MRKRVLKLPALYRQHDLDLELMEPRFTAVADSAVLVTFAEQINDDAHVSIVALDQAITRASPPGVIEVVPALVNLLVSFDPVVTDHVQIEAVLRDLIIGMTHQAGQVTSRTVRVCYEEPYELHLDAVAQACKLSREAVINAHLASDFKVLMYGFAPGYAYLDGLDKSIQVPRNPAPVRDIVAGSVIIAGQQCLVTTIKMPTGWSIIGRSPTKILLDDPQHFFLFDVGDEVTFERIDGATFENENKVGLGG